MIIQETREGVTVRIEVLGLTVGPVEKSMFSYVALWLLGYVVGSTGLKPSKRHVFNNKARQAFLKVIEETKAGLKELLG